MGSEQNQSGFFEFGLHGTHGMLLPGRLVQQLTIGVQPHIERQWSGQRTKHGAQQRVTQHTF